MKVFKFLSQILPIEKRIFFTSLTKIGESDFGIELLQKEQFGYCLDSNIVFCIEYCLLHVIMFLPKTAVCFHHFHPPGHNCTIM